MQFKKSFWEKHRRNIVLGFWIAMGVPGTYVAYRYLYDTDRARACSHISELAKTDKKGAHAAVERIVRKAEWNLTKGGVPFEVRSTSDYDRCKEALDAIHEALDSDETTPFFDCLLASKTAVEADACVPRSN